MWVLVPFKLALILSFIQCIHLKICVLYILYYKFWCTAVQGALMRCRSMTVDVTHGDLLSVLVVFGSHKLVYVTSAHHRHAQRVA